MVIYAILGLGKPQGLYVIMYAAINYSLIAIENRERIVTHSDTREIARERYNGMEGKIGGINGIDSPFSVHIKHLQKPC